MGTRGPGPEAVEESTEGIAGEPRPLRPIRKDEILVEERGLYIESWLPERRSRRRPLFFLHGELGGSWLWERYLSYFAQRGWEGHALNLRAHFWSDTADLTELDLASYVADAAAGLAALGRPAVVVGHGLGGLLAMKIAESMDVLGLVLISPALPRPIRTDPPPHIARLVPAMFRSELIGWAGAPAIVARQNVDLTRADIVRIQHLMGAESGLARRQMLEGLLVDPDAVAEIPTLVLGGGLDRLFAEADSERLAHWLGAEYLPFGAHSHYGLVLGEESHEQAADAIRAFLEAHRL